MRCQDNYFFHFPGYFKCCCPEPDSITQLLVGVELRCHDTGKIMKQSLWIIRMDIGVIAQIE